MREQTPTFTELTKRKNILVEILRKKGLTTEVSPATLLVRHQIQDPLHSGFFLSYCCNDCYSDLYCAAPSIPDELICPGCGWESAVSKVAAR